MRDYEHAGCSSRKAKKLRIPKRGPGVAELEKILRDQQDNRDGTDQKRGNVNKGGISYSPCSCFTAPSNVIALPANNINVNGGNGTGNATLSELAEGGCLGRSKGVFIGGSGVFLPEQTLLPVSWASSKGEEEPKVSSAFSFPLLVSKESDHVKLLPPLIWRRRHPSMSKKSYSSSTPRPSTSAGVCHHAEPPANQKTYLNYISTMSPEEDKMIETKRPRPNFPVDNWPPATPSRARQFLHFHPDVSRFDPSSSTSNNGVFNIGTVSRDPEPSTRPLELKVKNKCVNPNHQPDFSKFKQFSFHEEMKENLDGLLQKSSESEGLAPMKVFFNLLTQPEDQRAAEDTIGFKTEKCAEKTKCSIDLDLKL